MMRTFNSDDKEAGETSQNNTHGIRHSDPPKLISAVGSQQKISSNESINKNNGIPYRRSTPCPSTQIRSTGNLTQIRSTSNLPATSTGPKIEPTMKSNEAKPIMCINCKRYIMRGPLYHPLRKFCDAECAMAANKARKLGQEQAVTGVTADIQKIEKLGKEICKPTSEVQEEDEYYDDDIEDDPDSSINEDPVESPSSRSNSVKDFYMPPKKKTKKDENTSFDWIPCLEKPDFKAASVSLVKHAPLVRMWDNVTVGMKLEVENTDIDYLLMEKAFWVASVIQIQGYYVLLRYEGFGNNSSGDFWINLCSPSVHHVGWCANKGKPLIPPKSIAKKFTDWRNFLVNRLTGARTLPLNFVSKIALGIKSQNQLEDALEVVDKTQISQLRVAYVKKIVGRRLQVQYFDNDEDGGFWCHEESRLIHPAGWAKTIGHKVQAPRYYSPPPLASTVFDAEYEAMNLQVGMKLEAIDPLNLSAICAATIKQVLRRGYVMVRVDCYEEDSGGTDWFCYHISSPYVYPCGYCAANGITLTPPAGYDKTKFTWEKYFIETNAVPAPVKVKKILNHKFTVGMKVEVADLMDPRLICVATICQVVGRLLKIHFDGWEDEYDQWMDARSPDIYPIGWCEIVNHRLEPPRPVVSAQPPPLKKAKKGKKKVGIRAGKGTRAKNSVKNTKLKSSGPSPTNAKSIAAKMAGRKEYKPETNTSSAETIVMADHISSSNGGTEKKQETFRTAATNDFNNGREASTSRIVESIPNNFDNPDVELPDEPLTWTIQEVATFLKNHDCGSYCDGFIKNDIDGDKLMALTKDQIVLLTGMKVGPAVKIYELISQLKKNTSAAKARKSALSK